VAKSRKTVHEDRAAEYIDSSLMTQRLRFKKQLSARIDGRYGTYRTQVRLTSKIDGECTCPSEGWPCKHVRALRSTWEKNPDSFLDLEEYLRDIETRPKAQLVDIIRRMVLNLPQCLGVLGVSEFQEPSENEAAYH
jgi:SWIM zinc finger